MVCHARPVDQRVEQWWTQADPATKASVARIAPGQPLSAKLAWALQDVGLDARSIGQGAYAQPPEFAEALPALQDELSAR